MRKASVKDILRTVWKEKKRFISIMMITVLGVTMMTGLEAGCRDLKLSADGFFDSQNLFDVSIMSTLGLTEDDVSAIQKMDGIKYAEGTFTEIVHTKKGDVNKTAEIKCYKKDGLNIPYIVEGRLPQNANEIVVNEAYLKDTGKVIGNELVIEEIFEEDQKDSDEKNETADTITQIASENNENESIEGAQEKSELEDKISLDMDSEVELEEEETPNFPNTKFVIVGTIIDVMDINNGESSAAFRATPNADYTFFCD